ncbi:hypothetical protein, partial [Halorubrum sp. SP9]
MSDIPDLAKTAQLKGVNDLIERQRERIIEEANDQLERYIRKAIAEINWENVAILDIVHITRIDPDEFERTHGFQHHAYPSQELAPNVDTYYGIGDHHKCVYRLTEYQCQEIAVDP